MNVYDFDGTIYAGDSSLDFYFHCLKKYKKIFKRLPKQSLMLLKHYFYGYSKTQTKETFFSFLNDIEDIDKEIKLFWNKNNHKIKKWYLSQKRIDDVIISASPAFLLQPICEKLNIENLIASDVDKGNGHFNSDNCHDEMKVTYFRSRFPDARIEKFYTDSKSDLPLAEIADEAYLVKGDRFKLWKS